MTCGSDQVTQSPVLRNRGIEARLAKDLLIGVRIVGNDSGCHNKTKMPTERRFASCGSGMIEEQHIAR